MGISTNPTTTMNHITIIDGGMGRELHRRGAPFRQPEWSALALTEAPAVVRETHLDFIRAGAEVIITNSYAVVPFHIGARFAAEGEALAATAGRLAHEAVAESGQAVRVAASIPPLFGSYRPDLFDAARAAEIALPLIHSQAPYADIWLAETQSSIAEPATVKKLLPHDGKPYWTAFTLEDQMPHREPLLRSGERVADAVAAMLDLGVDAVLFNCSQPEVMEAAVTTARKVLDDSRSRAHLGVYANAFEPHAGEALAANDGLDTIRRDTTPPHYLAWAQRWCNAGADMVGGCCGIGPEHIDVLAKGLNP
ncbi:homocysteine S-methyltransferase family protein [Uruburuella testudinis]|uniref:Homocysteine S-methyltransferase family protein n=1 Tax=Uruburuella testudinis TaxID=1282863 RepID=A0ABY4DSS8_9NEIS|nr:homocysteine S-methyltransferase family protein [Uruburuella testudinis]UOO82098.1 homocysteine S-methyltransferase family protein [Uruburuella testudinis]